MDKKQNPDDLTFRECVDYQPIQTMKYLSMEEPELAEDAGCDTCVSYKNGQCNIHLK